MIEGSGSNIIIQAETILIIRLGYKEIPLHPQRISLQESSLCGVVLSVSVLVLCEFGFVE